MKSMMLSRWAKLAKLAAPAALLGLAVGCNFTGGQRAPVAGLSNAPRPSSDASVVMISDSPGGELSLDGPGPATGDIKAQLASYNSPQNDKSTFRMPPVQVGKESPKKESPSALSRALNLFAGKSNSNESPARRGSQAGKKSPKPGDPAKRSQMLANAQNLEKAGKLKKAREIYEDVIEQFPDHPTAYHRLGVVSDRQRRHDEAEKLFLRALAMRPNDAQLLNVLGYCFYLQGKLAKAQKALHEAVSLEPSNRRYRNNLGLVYGQMGNYRDAHAHFEKAGSKADALFNLAFVYASHNKSGAAKNAMKQALVADPRHEPARKALANFARYDQDPESAMIEAEYTADGVKLVPYVEGSGQGGVTTAAGDGIPQNRTAGQATRALQQQVRTMMQTRQAQSATQ